MRVHTTLGRSLVDFAPREPGRVAMYVCGPTVQAEPHVGHGRAEVVFDVIRRYLSWRGFEVTYVRNITDIEDKIIAAAAEAGTTPEEHAERIAKRFGDAYSALGVLEPDFEPKATDHVPEMLDLISTLIDRGLAYPADGDVYFSVRAWESYGRLSGRDLDELQAGARVEPSDLKRDPLDFALWKAAKPGEPWWESPWGAGRPGWHIECSAMAAKYLGYGFDIHGGGADLIFPHHENEIAQSEGASGRAFARYWLHNGLVNLTGEKMSKSTGHVIGLHEAIGRYGAAAVRMFYLRAHYRSPLEYSEALLAEAGTAWERLERFLQRPAGVGNVPDQRVLDEFIAAMDDDFDTAAALSVLFDAVREGNRHLDSGEEAGAILVAVKELKDVLGFASTEERALGLEPALADLSAELGLPSANGAEDMLDAIVGFRDEARRRRDFDTSDRIRRRLAEVGVMVEDTADGVRWHRRQG